MAEYPRGRGITNNPRSTLSSACTITRTSAIGNLTHLTVETVTNGDLGGGLPDDSGSDSDGSDYSFKCPSPNGLNLNGLNDSSLASSNWSSRPSAPKNPSAVPNGAGLERSLNFFGIAPLFVLVRVL